MGYIINELDTILERVLVVAPTSEELRDLFENISLEMTTELSPNKKANFNSSMIPSGSAISLFTAFNLGKRGSMTLRMALMGAQLEDGPIAPKLWQMADFAILSVDPTSLYSEEYLRSKLPREAHELPCVITGLESLEDEEKDLRFVALQRWFQKNFNKYHLASPKAKILSESLEWSLSF